MDNRESIPGYDNVTDNLEAFRTRNAIFKYHDMVYYMVVTVTTLGYGDISPVTVHGRYFMIAIFITFVYKIQDYVKEYSKVSNLTTPFSRTKYNKASKET